LLFEFLGIAEADRPPELTQPEARQRQLFATLDHLVRARSATAPAIIVVEDLQWLDIGSQGFLRNLIDGFADTRTLLLLSFRTSYDDAWLERDGYQLLHLGPLGTNAAGHLLRTLLGSHPSVDVVAERIQSRADGNPFFIEEIVRGLSERQLIGRRGAYRLADELEHVRIPASVQSVLEARIDGLPRAQKRVLHAASIVGRRFSTALLAKVTSLPAAELDGATDGLVSERLIRQDPEAGEGSSCSSTR
jgi:adenylate cyclase